MMDWLLSFVSEGPECVKYKKQIKMARAIEQQRVCLPVHTVNQVPSPGIPYAFPLALLEVIPENRVRGNP